MGVILHFNSNHQMRSDLNNRIHSRFNGDLVGFSIVLLGQGVFTLEADLLHTTKRDAYEIL
jgi:hypothetical protein